MIKKNLLFPQPASMAQLVERSAVNRQVLGSIPSGGVFLFCRHCEDVTPCRTYVSMGGWSSGMILASGARGRGFDSPQAPIILFQENLPELTTQTPWPSG